MEHFYYYFGHSQNKTSQNLTKRYRDFFFFFFVQLENLSEPFFCCFVFRNFKKFTSKYLTVQYYKRLKRFLFILSLSHPTHPEKTKKKTHDWWFYPFWIEMIKSYLLPSQLKDITEYLMAFFKNNCWVGKTTVLAQFLVFNNS